MKMICDPALCTGCEACRAVCHFSAVIFQADKYGFRRPLINQESCQDCGLCSAVCPVNRAIAESNTQDQRVYAAWIKDVKIRQESSSGGIFSAVAGTVLHRGGVVFGARWRKDFTVTLDCCENLEELADFRGSKYLQAETGNSYEKARAFLGQGREVLFAGTPCQIAGLKAFLKSDYERLVTIDLICHGVPSPMVFQSYRKELEARFQSEVGRFRFRYKKPAWASCSVQASFINSAKYRESVQKDPFFVGFTSQLFLRECCYRCKYATRSRVSDLTLSDFWGYRADCWHMRDFGQGCSGVLVNTEKGRNLFQSLLPELICQERTFGDLLSGNPSLQRPWPKSNRSDAFWEAYFAGESFWDMVPRFFPPQRLSRVAALLRLKERYRFLIPASILNAVRK